MERAWIALFAATLAVFLVFANGMGIGKSSQSFGGSHDNNQRYQKWYDWMVKRQLGSSGNDAAFGRFLQNGGKFVDWSNVFDGKRGKRQLSNFQDRFGNYQRFFTNGLQDWKSTFNGEKRTLED